MRNSRSDAYAAAGVDITAGYKAVELMKQHVARTMIPGAGDIGGFGGVFEPDLSGMRRPCLVSGTDGVGTKIRIAQLMDRYDTVGIDCVAMCVNDIVCSGARPLFFWTISPSAEMSRTGSRPWFPASRKAACRRAVR